MSRWKKALLWVVGILVGVSTVIVGGFIALFSILADGLCATSVFDQLVSPNGELKAVLYQIDCGATTAFNSHVSIVPSDTDTSEEDSFSGHVFAADCNRGQAPEGKGRGPEVRWRWISDKEFEIRYHQNAQVFVKKFQVDDFRIIKSQVDDVRIIYSTFVE